MIHVRVGESCGYACTNSTTVWECSQFKYFTMKKLTATSVPTAFCRFRNQINPFFVETTFSRDSIGLDDHRSTHAASSTPPIHPTALPVTTA